MRFGRRRSVLQSVHSVYSERPSTKFAWINPEPQGVWQYRQSIAIIQQLMGQRMFPLTLKGLEDAMRMLSK